MRPYYYLIDRTGEIYSESYSKSYLEDIIKWYRRNLRPEAFNFREFHITTEKPEAVE